MRSPDPIAKMRRSDRPRQRDLKVLRSLWPFMRPYGRQILGAAVALVTAASVVLGLGSGVRYLIDGGFAAQDPQLLDRAVLVLVGGVFVLALSTYARFSLVAWIGERVVADLRQAVYRRVVALSPAFFEVTKTGEILSRLTSDTSILQVVVGSQLSMAVRNLLLFIGGTVLLLLTSAKLTGLMLLVVPITVAPLLIFGRRVRRLSRDSQDRIADMSGQAEETLAAIRTLQAFTQEAREEKRFSALTEKAFGSAVQRIRARAILVALIIFLIFGAITVVLWAGGHDVLAGRLSPGDLSAFVFYAIVVASAVGALAEVMGDLQRAAGATERLVELLRLEPEIKAPAAPLSLPSPARGAIAFEAVRFNYPARPQQSALLDFSFAVAPGEKVALVGPSGAGKTTVFQLLLRFYDPQNGRITFDGLDLKACDPRELRRHLALVAQEPVIFSADAWENIRYGRPEASEAEVLAAAEAAQARGFLEALPQGFATFLGERGVRLSGGQRQRLAIARALLRDPPLLLLDEATSALDAESERAVQQALDRLMVGRTTIIIAHRLATVLKADRIVVMDEGRVVASGTHGQLLQQGGLYARLAALQFSDGGV